MIKFFSGNIKLIKEAIQEIAVDVNMKARFSKDIYKDVARQYGLFYTPEVLYCLYDSNVDYSILNSKTPVIVIIETKLDKRSSFYKQFGKQIKVFGNQKEVTLDDKVNNFFKDRRTIAEVDESEMVSFLYKIFYDFKRPYYKEQAGKCINLVLTGKVRTNNIKQVFILELLDK